VCHSGKRTLYVTQANGFRTSPPEDVALSMRAHHPLFWEDDELLHMLRYNQPFLVVTLFCHSICYTTAAKPPRPEVRLTAGKGSTTSMDELVDKVVKDIRVRDVYNCCQAISMDKPMVIKVVKGIHACGGVKITWVWC